VGDDCPRLGVDKRISAFAACAAAADGRASWLA
jgi:hypothetical protein